MTMLGTALLVSLGLLGASLSGNVLDVSGAPLAGVDVFVEPGLGGRLIQQDTDASGKFQFDNLPAGATGVFVAEAAHAFAGRHVNLSVGDNVPNITLRLAPADTVQGTIRSAEGEALKGAQITRIALTGTSKVGIPLSKLAPYGFSIPVTDADGKFVVGNLPRGETVALKAGHGSYAQEGVQDVRVGERNLVIELYRGVLVEGSVTDRRTQTPAANIAVLLRNAQPPHDTAVAETNAGGGFSIRLKPGVYLYGATGAGIQSAGWEQIRVSGESGRQVVKLTVAPAGTVSGVFRDAVTTAPIAGVRVSLYSSGVRASVQRTGPGGAYQFMATEGPSAIRIESAPGYLPPPTPDIPFVVTAGENVELAELWLAPMPRVSLDIEDESGARAAGAVVQLLRPAQFGWQSANADGKLNLLLSSVPSGERVFGFVESNPAHPSAQAAVFSLLPNSGESPSVKLFPVARLQGRVLSDAGTPLEGVEVGGVFAGETDADTPLLLWRVRTNAEGQYLWPAIAPGVPQQIVARDTAGSAASLPPINLAPGERHEAADLLIPSGRGASSGPQLVWDARNFDVLCGERPDWKALKKKPVFAVCTRSADVDAVGESLEAAAPHFRALGIETLIITDDAYLCGSMGMTVLKARDFGSPRSVLVLADSTNALVSDGLPSFAALKALLHDAE